MSNSKLSSRALPKHGRQAGFTLVEILVAAAILGTSLLAIASLFVGGIQRNAIAKEETVMAAFAQDRLEELRRVPAGGLEGFFSTTGNSNDSCQGLCTTPTCANGACYEDGCPAASLIAWQVEDPIRRLNAQAPSINELNESRWNLYVRYWEIQKVSLGSPVGCVYKISVFVGSRNGLLVKRPTTSNSWLLADWQEVVGRDPADVTKYTTDANPRRVVVSMYRLRG